MRADALRAGAFFDARRLVARDLFAVTRLFADVRLLGVRLRAVRLLAGVRLVVARFAALGRFFAFLVVLVVFLRGVLCAPAVRFFAAFLRGAAFARVLRFFAVVLRGPVFLAVALRALVLFDCFFVPPAFARVARFFAGAFRGRAFLALALRAGALRRVRIIAAGAVSSSYVGGGLPAYSGCSSSAPKARRPARQAAMMTAPNP